MIDVVIQNKMKNWLIFLVNIVSNIYTENVLFILFLASDHARGYLDL